MRASHKAQSISENSKAVVYCMRYLRGDTEIPLVRTCVRTSGSLQPHQAPLTGSPQPILNTQYSVPEETVKGKHGKDVQGIGCIRGERQLR